MKMKLTRKQFIKTLGLASVVAPFSTQVSAQKKNTAQASTHLLNLGLASYSLRELSLEETIKVAKKLELNSIAFKSMHMPLDSNESSIKEIVSKVQKAGLDLYGAGVIYMKSQDEVTNAFNYAKHAGLKVIIGVPNYELLPLVEQKVKETNIKLAIHNHGPGDDVYPSPDSIYEKVKDLDTRIGMCIDIGHTFRIGQNPSKKAKQYAERLHDIHLKDVDGLGAEGKTLELGRGIMDIPGFIKTLKKIKYKGVVALEYEKDGKEPVPGLAESVGYAKGVMDVV